MGHTLQLTGGLAPGGVWRVERCMIARAVDVVPTRFADFAERVGISEPVAAARLRELVEHGLLAPEDYREPGQRPRLTGQARR